MRNAALLALCVTLAASAQTRIATDIEIRQMEQVVRDATDFSALVAAHINLGELRRQRNEPTAAAREFATALELARRERDDARKARQIPRYALATVWSGAALAKLGRGVEAFAVLEEGVRYAADSRGIWNVYSTAMFRLGASAKAIGAARISVAAAERMTAGRAGVREWLDLNFDRFALAQGLLQEGIDTTEAEQLLLQIAESLDSERFAPLRKSLGRREEFQILTAPTTESGMWLSAFHRAHIRLAMLHEDAGAYEKALREYKTVISRRSDDPTALAGIALLTADPKERDRYLVLSLDANPFALDVVEAYEGHVARGDASPEKPSGSAGSRVRLAIRQIHARDFRRARETLLALIDEHPHNEVLEVLLARTEVSSGRPRFLDEAQRLILNPSEADLRSVLGLFAANTITAADRATLDRAELSSMATFEGGAFERGEIQNVPFRFQSPAIFRGISSAEKTLRLRYRIVGATTVDGRDALLLEPIRAEAGK